MLLKFRIRIPYKKYEVVKSSAHKIDGKTHIIGTFHGTTSIKIKIQTFI